MIPVRALFLVLAGATSALHAKDLGTVGRTYPIKEPDFRAVLHQQMQQTVVPKLQQNDTTKALDRYVDRAPKLGLSVPQKTQLRQVDVTQVLARDIWAPQRTRDGRIEHIRIGRKGQRLDPFEKGILPQTAFLVIDGRDPRQLALAEQVHRWTPLVYLVLDGGDPRPLASKLDAPVDLLPPQMADLFQLRYVPSFIYAKKGQKGGEVWVLEMAAPFALTQVQEKWTPGLQGRGGLDAIRRIQDENRDWADRQRIPARDQ